MVTSIYAAPAEEARRQDNILLGAFVFMTVTSAIVIGYAFTLEETKEVVWNNLQQPIAALL